MTPAQTPSVVDTSSGIKIPVPVRSIYLRRRLSSPQAFPTRLWVSGCKLFPTAHPFMLAGLRWGVF